MTTYAQHHPWAYARRPQASKRGKSRAYYPETRPAMETSEIQRRCYVFLLGVWKVRFIFLAFEPTLLVPFLARLPKAPRRSLWCLAESGYYSHIG